MDEDALSATLRSNMLDLVARIMLGRRPSDYDDARYIEHFYADVLMDAIRCLPDRESMAISYRYGLAGDGLKRSHKDVGELMGFGAARSRQVIDKGIRRLRYSNISKPFVTLHEKMHSHD